MHTFEIELADVDRGVYEMLALRGHARARVLSRVRRV
jgi:hypothetical protein